MKESLRHEPPYGNISSAIISGSAKPSWTSINRALFLEHQTDGLKPNSITAKHKQAQIRIPIVLTMISWVVGKGFFSLNQSIHTSQE
jgi:hypothetical protein